MRWWGQSCSFQETSSSIDDELSSRLPLYAAEGRVRADLLGKTSHSVAGLLECPHLGLQAFKSSAGCQQLLQSDVDLAIFHGKLASG